MTWQRAHLVELCGPKNAQWLEKVTVRSPLCSRCVMDGRCYEFISKGCMMPCAKYVLVRITSFLLRRVICRKIALALMLRSNLQSSPIRSVDLLFLSYLLPRLGVKKKKAIEISKFHNFGQNINLYLIRCLDLFHCRHQCFFHFALFFSL